MLNWQNILVSFISIFLFLPDTCCLLQCFFFLLSNKFKQQHLLLTRIRIRFLKFSLLNRSYPVADWFNFADAFDFCTKICSYDCCSLFVARPFVPLFTIRFVGDLYYIFNEWFAEWKYFLFEFFAFGGNSYQTCLWMNKVNNLHTTASGHLIET